ncbi:MAG: hypothetical protein ABI462_00805 [Ignavibacteria bacterium]
MLTDNAPKADPVSDLAYSIFSLLIKDPLKKEENVRKSIETEEI